MEIDIRLVIFLGVGCLIKISLLRKVSLRFLVFFLGPSIHDVFLLINFCIWFVVTGVFMVF